MASLTKLVNAEWQQGAGAQWRGAAPPPPLRWRRCKAPAPEAAAVSRLHSSLSSGSICTRAQLCHIGQTRHVEAAAAASPAANACADGGPADSTAFDWELSLALAGCAFEAYNEVEPEGGSLKMTSMGGTEITFVDRDFLSRKFAGLMEVTLVGARGLPAADWWPGAKSDPYAVVNIGDSAGASAVAPQTLEPRWGETLLLFVSDPTAQRLSLRVLDADVGKADDLLGSAMRGLQDLVDGQEHDLELPLRGPKGAAGTVSLRLRFLPFDGALAGGAAAQQMGGPVTGSPPATITSSQWRDLQMSVLDAAADAMFDPVAFIDNPETDTQAWLFWNPATRRLCVSFRGTEQVKWKDILTDLRLTPASLDPEGLAEGPWRRPPQLQGAEKGARGGTPPVALTAALVRSVAAEKLQGQRANLRAAATEGLRSLLLQRQAEAEADVAAAGEEGVWVHSGFLQAYTSLRPELLRLLDTALAGETEPWTLYVTGHSLGGALSTLCAFDCARRPWRRAPRPHLVHYNYGSPRVGNKAFADAFDALVPNTWRVANARDAVTLVPRMLGYCHVGHKAELGGEGGTLQLLRNSRTALGEGAEGTDVVLAAAINMQTLAQQMLSKDQQETSGSSSQSGGSTGADMKQQQAGGLALPSPAAVLVAAAGVLASAAQQQQEQGRGRQAANAVADLAAADAAVGTGAAASSAAASGTSGFESEAMPVASAQEVQALLEEEITAMSRLLDGSALSEHLEPLYLENLRAAIDQLQQRPRAQ